MKILKFGGTSVGSAQRMRNVADLIITDRLPKIVVLSAVSGTTNALVEIADLLSKNETTKASEAVSKLHEKYVDLAEELYTDQPFKDQGQEIISEHFGRLGNILRGVFSSQAEKEILAQGELLSTRLFAAYLTEQNIPNRLLMALDFMKLDEDQEPDIKYISEHLRPLLHEDKDSVLYITQGYICRNARGEIDNLQRGGSDYTASLLGAAIRAEEVQIWTDIDGMHNNDPRVVKKTIPIAELSFDEAAELAYFGAKILHPSSILPAQKFNVPVRLLNTIAPEAKGTIIYARKAEAGVKAIAAKDNIIALKIKSSRMLLAYGFLRRVFEVFEKYRTPIDMITTSEVAVSLTIDNPLYLHQICQELDKFGQVETDEQQTIVCIVGDNIVQQKGIANQVFDALEEIPLRMISYGGSRNNISLLIDTRYKQQALEELNRKLFRL